MFLGTRTAAVLASLLASACMMVPVRTTDYDEGCRVVTHHLVLQAVQVADLQRCGGDNCVGALIVAAGAAVVSTIVSGSIVVVGNVAYWAERRAGCLAPA